MRSALLALLFFAAAAAADDSFVFRDDSAEKRRPSSSSLIETRLRQTKSSTTTGRPRVVDRDAVVMPDQVSQRSTTSSISVSKLRATTHHYRHHSTTTAPPGNSSDVILDTRVMANAPNRDCEEGYVRNMRSGKCKKMTVVPLTFKSRGLFSLHCRYYAYSEASHL
ncbi:uncharacterized protein LOC132202754 [Neocloeon triangulifer]|uniref:uncharacterized protein LOC132202754 n=1 Tax=Neocloeon triangulifer TaxID=2078957 RepID=UPI00286EF5CA|nr:uncharacterized protein LOC132202754 [Neocloeon triangulifer]